MDSDVKIGSEVFIIVKQKICEIDGWIMLHRGGMGVSEAQTIRAQGIYPAKVVGIQTTNRLSLLIKTGKRFDQYVYMLSIATLEGTCEGNVIGVEREDLYLTQEEALQVLESEQQ
jgi:hypothetical protein